MGFKDWLQLFRAQTAPATVLSILLPYLIAGGRDPLMIAIIVVLGTLTHYASFGHNSVMDYFFDIHDPNKKHHPLESDKISLEKAVKTVNLMMVALTLAWVVVCLEFSPMPVASLVFLIMYVVFGHAYNDWMDKMDVNSHAEIAGCFMALTAFGWSLATSIYNTITILVMIFAGLTIFYQIAWEGNLKDLWNPKERNLLSDEFGFKVVNNRVVGPKHVNYFFMVIRLGVNTVMLALIGVLMGNSAGLGALAGITIIEAYAVGRMHLNLGSLSRDKLLDLMGLAEATEFFRLAVLLPMTLWIPIIVFSMMYFIIMNQMLWESRLGPRV